LDQAVDSQAVIEGLESKRCVDEAGHISQVSQPAPQSGPRRCYVGVD
jgi:hypothetical protein